MIILEQFNNLFDGIFYMYIYVTFLHVHDIFTLFLLIALKMLAQT